MATPPTTQNVTLSPDASLDYCSSCGICTQVCPQGVHIAEINSQARAKLKSYGIITSGDTPIGTMTDQRWADFYKVANLLYEGAWVVRALPKRC